MLKPLGDRIVVKPGPEEEVTKGGILLPDTARKKPREGEVLAVGPGRLLENGERAPLEVKVGDTIVYSEFGGTELTIGGEDYVILEESQALAIREKRGSKAKKAG
jgi:chaperonin GroES